jgi:hypothetical protein
MRMHTLALAVPALVLAAGCAHQRSDTDSQFVTMEPEDVSPRITRYADEDRDGFVTRKEAKADPALTASFDKYDANDDDKLDRAEFARLEAEGRDEQERASRASASSGPWITDLRPDGYFGPERPSSQEAESLNRTGGGPSRSEESE